MTPDPFRRFCAAYAHATHQLSSVRLDRLAGQQLPSSQLRLLAALGQYPGGTTTQLAHTLGLSVSTTSEHLSQLVDRGLVARHHLTDDRRQIPLDLTPNGRLLLHDLGAPCLPSLRRVAASLGSDLPWVTSALERLAQAADLPGEGAGPPSCEDADRRADVALLAGGRP